MRWLAILLVFGSASAVAAPLDKPAFTATPAELLAIAKATPGSEVATVLRQDVVLEVDSLGRRTRRLRFVFVLRSQAGIDEWGELFHIWRPFFQSKPAVRARVIAPSQTVTELDPKTLRDEQASVSDQRRKIVVPLPALSIGSVVEEEVVIRDREPILGPLGLETIHLGDNVPTASARVVVTAPVARKLQVVAQNTGAVPRHEVTGATERWTLEVSLPATPAREDHAPGSVSTSVRILVGIAPSWNAVARGMRALIDKRIAEGPVALPSTLPTTPTVETVRAITAWLRSKVRSNGFDLKDSVLVPATPATTLSRGSADTKDLATLLVSALRQAKIRAEVALIEEGPNADLSPAVPGIDVFDHVLVRARVANRDVWIEIDEELALPGVLTQHAEGRNALILADDTTALVETPRSRSIDNVLREVRTFEIPEYGSSRVTITTRATGALEPEYRRWIADADDLETELRDDLTDRFVAKSLARHTVSDATDLTKPFELTTVLDHSERATGEREQVVAYLWPSDTASRFHDLLSESPRTTDFVWLKPHVHEIENRLTIPDGFVLPTPAKPQTRQLGALTFTRTEALDGRTYVVTFRLDTGKPRWSPAETIATAKAMVGFEDERMAIKLDLVAVALANEGKVKEAIAELDRLIKLHPKEALHHSQLLQLYIRAGMGAAARREGRKAVQLQPNDADAHVVLAWALRRDSHGREYGYDHDRQGAIAAYQRARKLDPEHLGAMADFASLLSVGANGRAFERDADPRSAAIHWRAAAAIEADYTDELVRALIHADQFKEAEQVALAAKPSDARDMLLIAALAGGPGGVPAALAKATTLAKGPAVNTLLDNAASVLFTARNYEPMRALWGRTGKYTGTSFEQVVTKVKRMDSDKRDRGDPKTAYRQATHWLADLAWPKDAIWDDSVAFGLRIDSRIPSMLKDYNHALLEDVLQTAEVKVEGATAGPWRVTSMFTGAALYIARDRGTAKVLGSSKAMDGVGAEVIRALARNDQPAAFQLLDWLRADLGGEPMGRLLDKILLGRTKDAAALAGAILSSPKLDASIPILRECKDADAALKKLCAFKLGSHLGRSPKQLEAHARAVLAADPANDEAAMMLIRALTIGGKLPEAHRLLDARLKTDPTDQEARRAKAYALSFDSKFADAIQLHETTSWGTDAASDLNEAAWLRLVANLDLGTALANARKAVESTAAKPRGTLLHTLAAIEIERGNVTEAIDAIQRAMDVRFRARPEPGDWYVYGRIAEHLGLAADAADAYKKVTPEPDPTTRPPIGSYHLAQRRLKSLKR